MIQRRQLTQTSQEEKRIRCSVIIPAYNVASSLGKAVASVLAQTEQNFEIIIVDDASTDHTWEIAQALAGQDSRIRAMQMPKNGGKSIASNHATDMAQGKWIAMLDGDDWFAPTRLAILLDAVEATDFDMVADNQIYIDLPAAGREVGTAFPVQHACHILDLDLFLNKTDATARFDYGMLKPIFRAEFLRSREVRYHEAARNGQDYYMMLCYLVAGGRGLVLDAPLYYYVQPFGSISGQWAQAGRRRYNFELNKEVNEHFLRLFHDVLTTAQRRGMERRSNALQKMISFHQMRECLEAGNMMGATHRALHAPVGLWSMIAKRAVKRMKRRHAIAQPPIQ